MSPVTVAIWAVILLLLLTSAAGALTAWLSTGSQAKERAFQAAAERGFAAEDLEVDLFKRFQLWGGFLGEEALILLSEKQDAPASEGTRELRVELARKAFSPRWKVHTFSSRSRSASP